MSEEQGVRTCPTFNSPRADVILRSSDNVDFHTFRIILSEASPFFDSMFTIPQPLSEPNDDVGHKNGLPIIPVSEKSKTIEAVLRFCHPISDPKLDQLDDLQELLTAATKYELSFIATSLRRQVVPFLEEHPLRVYAIAYIHEWEAEARLAARATLRKPSSELLPAYASQTIPPEFQVLPAVALIRLRRYHQACVDRLQSATSDWNFFWVASLDIGWRIHCYQCGQPSNTKKRYISPYWTDLNSKVTVALKERPCSIAVEEPSHVAGALAQVCSSCPEDGPTKMAQYIKNLAMKVDSYVSTVVLELPFKDLDESTIHAPTLNLDLDL
ncbi:hypothetical protein JAAARDRAFT_146605 [Jaapia argillacea MUCL 33604]|uniref:BTB domain-containing protein n=1 Tax=Jaapia argillacea MUCL 33604 TaxID=933084 RepID=A0A067QH49_9AGAM|nr:hypothetical protein JAAARDRAFT_146605 [Jaapia argillacea MUCL 33604]